MDIISRFLCIVGLLLCSVTAQSVFYLENFEGATPSMTVTGGAGNLEFQLILPVHLPFLKEADAQEQNWTVTMKQANK